MAKEKREKTLVAVPENAMREEVNTLIRDGLKIEGQIKGDSIKLSVLKRQDMTHAQISNAKDYSKGDIVVFNKRYSSLSIQSGEALTVSEIKDFNVVKLKNEAGKEILWQPHRIAGRRKGVIEVYKEQKIELQPGDKIRWTKNSKEDPSIINSGIAKVVSVDKESITFDIGDGKQKVIALNNKLLKHMDYGYAGTVHFMQGKTEKYVISVLESGHVHFANQKMFNVIISRPKYYLKLFTDDKEALIKNLKMNTGERDASIEHQGFKYSDLASGEINLESLKVNNSKQNMNINVSLNVQQNNQALSKSETSRHTTAKHMPAREYEKYFDERSIVNTNKTTIKQNLQAQKEVESGSKIQVQVNAGKENTQPKSVSEEFKRDKYTTKDIYRQLYSKLPSLLPEFGFRYKGGHYISTTGQRIDGSTGKGKGKVYVYANNPGVLVDYSRKSVSLWDYVKDHYIASTSNSDVMDYLLDQAGLKTHHNGISHLNLRAETPKEPMMIEEKRPEVDKKLLGDIHSFAKDNLLKNDNDVLKYLKNERGYGLEVIKAMELGFIAKKEELGKYLRSLGWSDEKIKEAYRMLHLIGKTHNLVIPYKDAEGNVIGLAGRNINHTEASEIGKYLYTRGLSRNNTLLNIHNIKEGKEAVIVEGMLDCLHAHAKGIDNVIALGGTGFNQNQIKILHQAGISKINLCLDNDKAGREASNKICEVANASGFKLEIKQATLPDKIKDPDQMIKEKGIESFKAILATAKALTLDSSNATSLKANIKEISKLTSNISQNNAILNVKDKDVGLEL